MRTREVVAFLLLPLVLAGIVFLPPWAFLAVIGAVLVLAHAEWLRMAVDTGVPLIRPAALLALPAVVIAAWVWGAIGLAVGLIAVAVILPAVQLGHRDGSEGSLAANAIAVWSVVHLGTTGACLGWLRTHPGDALGVRLILFYLFVIWIGDSGAYYVGKSLGRRKMAPRISPNKTVEGLAGGTVATFVGAVLFRWLLVPSLPLEHALAVAAILAVAAPVGDLIESQLKRDTDVKDSSTLLPGHGGVLDRTDSVLYGAPPVLAYLLVVGWPA